MLFQNIIKGNLQFTCNNRQDNFENEGVLWV